MYVIKMKKKQKQIGIIVGIILLVLVVSLVKTPLSVVGYFSSPSISNKVLIISIQGSFGVEGPNDGPYCFTTLGSSWDGNNIIASRDDCESIGGTYSSTPYNSLGATCSLTPIDFSKAKITSDFTVNSRTCNELTPFAVLVSATRQMVCINVGPCYGDQWNYAISGKINFDFSEVPKKCTDNFDCPIYYVLEKYCSGNDLMQRTNETYCKNNECIFEETKNEVLEVCEYGCEENGLVKCSTAQCQAGDIKYYECEDGSQVQHCTCENNKWNCIENPEVECKEPSPVLLYLVIILLIGGLIVGLTYLYKKLK